MWKLATVQVTKTDTFTGKRKKERKKERKTSHCHESQFSELEDFSQYGHLYDTCDYKCY